MKNMKRVIVVSLLFPLLVACGADAASSKGSKESAGKETSVTQPEKPEVPPIDTVKGGSISDEGEADNEGPGKGETPASAINTDQFIVGYEEDSEIAKKLAGGPATGKIDELLPAGEADRISKIFSTVGLTVKRTDANSGGAVAIVLSGEVDEGKVDELLSAIRDGDNVSFAEPVLTATK